MIRRIALVAPPWYPVPPRGYGGIELVVDLLARELRALGHEVVLFAAEDSAAASHPICVRDWAAYLGGPQERVRELAYGALAASASGQTPPKDVALKDPKDFVLIGQPLKRLDTPDKANGKAVYGIDAILPGMTETERVEQLFRQRAAASGKSVEEVRASLIAKDGVARLGKPEDIAALALFLCSQRARHIQGTAIAVDGGATPGLY